MRRRLRQPPRIKVLEAAGALGDGRVSVSRVGGGLWRGTVTSSDGSRTYRVAVRSRGPGLVEAYSDDNGTRLRGYVGYPIIAAMMLAGLLPRSPGLEEALRGIPWKRLNEKYKKYSIVMDIALRTAEERGYPRSEALAFVDRVMKRLRETTVLYSPGLVEGGSDPAERPPPREG